MTTGLIYGSRLLAHWLRDPLNQDLLEFLVCESHIFWDSKLLGSVRPFWLARELELGRTHLLGICWYFLFASFAYFGTLTAKSHLPVLACKRIGTRSLGPIGSGPVVISYLQIILFSGPRIKSVI